MISDFALYLDTQYIFDFAAERISCFQANNLKELFKD